MTLLDAYEAILALGASPAHAARVASMRATFEERTGRFTPEDAWFEARSRAFWDDAATRGRFGRVVVGSLSKEAQVWVPRLERAHRGLFVPSGRHARAILLRDLWSGAELRVDDVDEGLRDALSVASAPFDARLVGMADPARVGMLPGAVFHPADAIEPIAKVLDAARAADLGAHDVLDALLRMERTLRSLTRMKAAYAYRPESLTSKAPAH